MRSALRPVAVAAILAAILSPLVARAAPVAQPDAENETATRMILCDCGCPPQSVHDCACGHAADVRAQIAAEIASGKTAAQVIDAYVARYGQKIRIVPEARGFNLLAWIGPALALLGGAGLSVLVLRRWRRSSASAASGPPAAAAAGDEGYVSRIERQLRDYE